MNLNAMKDSPRRARIWFSYNVSRNELTALHFPFLVAYTLCRFLIWMHLNQIKNESEWNNYQSQCKSTDAFKFLSMYLLSSSCCFISKLIVSTDGSILSFPGKPTFGLEPSSLILTPRVAVWSVSVVFFFQKDLLKMKFHG